MTDENKLIIQDSELARTSFSPAELLRDNSKKIIFIGRSNVGKSSLINKLLNRKRLARTSSTPGKTVSVNYYRITAKNQDGPESFHFVDLPGYGYARIPRKEAERVKGLLATFFRHVENARLVVLLIDIRRGFLDSDLEILPQIMDKKIKMLTVLTKSDKLRNSEVKNQKEKLRKEFGLSVVAFTIKSNENRQELLSYINQALME